MINTPADVHGIRDITKILYKLDLHNAYLTDFAAFTIVVTARSTDYAESISYYINVRVP